MNREVIHHIALYNNRYNYSKPMKNLCIVLYFL